MQMMNGLNNVQGPVLYSQKEVKPPILQREISSGQGEPDSFKKQEQLLDDRLAKLNSKVAQALKGERINKALAYGTIAVGLAANFALCQVSLPAMAVVAVATTLVAGKFASKADDSYNSLKAASYGKASLNMDREILEYKKNMQEKSGQV